jgi:hypothetical protein
MGNNWQTKNHREKIIGTISDNCNLIHSDVNTFLWVKTDMSDEFENVPENYFIGGGNLLMVHGLFAIINYLAKAYKILRKGYDIDNKLKVSLNNFLENTISVNGKSKKAKKYFQFKPEINETDAFAKFIEDSEVDWGLTEDQIKEVWNFYRNSLTHMAIPKGLISGTRPESIAYQDKKKQFEVSSIKTFFKHSKKPLYACNADMLNRDTMTLVEWLCKEIFDEDKYSDEQIQRLYSWLEIENI